MRREFVALLSGFVLLFVTSGCKCEDSDIFKAYKTFREFSGGKDFTVDTDSTGSAYLLVKRKVENISGRERALADIEVDPWSNRAQLEAILRDACHDDRILGGASAVKVRAWPGKLRKLVTPMGTSVFARDGHGWDGKSVGFEKIDITSATSVDQAGGRTASISENDYFRVLAIENQLNSGRSLEDAIQKVASRHSESEDALRAAVQRTQGAWGKPAQVKGP